MTIAFGLMAVAALLLNGGITKRKISDVIAGAAPGKDPQNPGEDPAVQAVGEGANAVLGGTGNSGNGVDVNPFGGSGGGILTKKHLGRTDMGVDFTGAGPILSPADGKVTRVVPHGGPSGWPGGGFVVVHADYPVGSGITSRYFYIAENITPKVHQGQRVQKGDVLAIAHGTYPFIETGLAANAQGTTLSVAHHTQNTHPNHSNTPEGRSWLKWLGL